MAPMLVLTFAVSALSLAWIVGVARMVFGKGQDVVLFGAVAPIADGGRNEFSAELPTKLPEHVSIGRISRF